MLLDEKLSTTKEMIKSLRDLIQDQDHSHSMWSKILAAFWGSAVFHFALLLYASGNLSTDLEKILRVTGFWGPLIIIVYSLTFGLTVAVSKPKRSLVRHFLYGALLPAFAYGLAAGLFYGK